MRFLSIIFIDVKRCSIDVPRCSRPRGDADLSRSLRPVGEGLAPPAVYVPRPIFAPPRRGRRPRRPAPRHAHGVIVRFRLTVDPGSIFTVPGGASPSPTTGRIGFRVNRYPFAIPTPGRRGRRPLQMSTPGRRGRRPLQTSTPGRAGTPAPTENRM